MGSGEHMSDMLTVSGVARIFHVHPNTLRRWSNNRRIRAYRITERCDRRCSSEEIIRFLDEIHEHGKGGQEA